MSVLLDQSFVEISSEIPATVLVMTVRNQNSNIATIQHTQRQRKPLDRLFQEGGVTYWPGIVLDCDMNHIIFGVPFPMWGTVTDVELTKDHNGRTLTKPDLTYDKVTELLRYQNETVATARFGRYSNWKPTPKPFRPHPFDILTAPVLPDEPGDEIPRGFLR